MIVHIVMWKLKPEVQNRDEALQRIGKALEGLPGEIAQIKGFEVGVPNLSASPAGFDISLYSRFDSLDDLESYRVHPEHQKVAELIQSLTGERAVVDYQA